MSSLLGAIEVQMLLDLARWNSDITNANRLMDQGLLKMKQGITGALGGLVAGLGVAAFTSWIKGAIDAGDEAFNLSKKMGMAAEDVAGIQLAFKMAGVESGGMQTAMVKLSKGVAEGDEVFKRLGVSVRNSDGSLKSSKQVLYDVADVFEVMPDGINKTALATEVFGKAGADLLPLLDDGSAGLREMADMAERLGLVIDGDTAAAADSFNDTLDLLGATGQGMARQVAAELLPTLNSLAGSLLDNATSGDKLKKGAEVLGSALKILFAGGAIGVEVFNTLGKVIGGVGGAVIAVAQGEFSEAKRILEESGRDIGRGWGETAKTITDAWDGTGAATVEKAGAMTKALGGTTVATKAQADAAKKAAEEQAKLVKAGQQDYLNGINAQYGAMQLQISLGRDLTEGEKELVKLNEQLASGKLALTEAERRSVEMKLREIDAVKEAKRQADEYARTVAAVSAHTTKWADEQAKNTETLRAGNVALLEENDKLRLGEAAWNARQRAVLLSQAADLEWQAASQGGNWQLEEQARLLRERAKLLADGTALKEAKAVTDEWAKTTESIKNGLTDALMRGFESGKGFAENFADVLKNAFKTLVLKPMVDAMVGQMSGGLQGLMGTIGSWAGSGTASGSTGGSAAASGAGASSSLGWLGWILAGVQQSRSDYAKGWNREGLDQGWNQNINWAINPVYATMIKPLEKLGLISSKTADILGGDTAMARLFGRKPAEATARGVTGAFGAGGFVGQAFVDWKADGGTFRSDKSGTNFSAINAGLGALLGDQAQQLLDQATVYGRALGLPVSQLAGITAQARIELGDDAEANLKAIQKALGLYGDELAKQFEQQLAAAALPGEAAADTLTRLGEAIVGVNTTFEALGLHLVRTSVAGGEAAAELVRLTGGMDQFLAKTQTYLGAYFSQEEQLGLGAKNVLRTLADAGIDFSGANERADLRTLLEQLDPNTLGGREQMAALLNVAGDFARVADYLQEQGLTLGGLAALAPAVGVLVDDPATRGASAAEQSAALLQTSNDRLASIAQSTADTNAQLQAMLALQAAAHQALLAQLQAMQQAQEDAARMADLVPREDTGG